MELVVNPKPYTRNPVVAQDPIFNKSPTRCESPSILNISKKASALYGSSRQPYLKRLHALRKEEDS